MPFIFSDPFSNLVNLAMSTMVIINVCHRIAEKVNTWTSQAKPK